MKINKTLLHTHFLFLLVPFSRFFLGNMLEIKLEINIDATRTLTLK